MYIMPLKILDWINLKLRSKNVPLVRVLWRNTQIEKETRKKEAKIKMKYLRLFIYLVIK